MKEASIQDQIETHIYEQIKDEAITRALWIKENISQSCQKEHAETLRIMSDYILMSENKKTLAKIEVLEGLQTLFMANYSFGFEAYIAIGKLIKQLEETK